MQKGIQRSRIKGMSFRSHATSGSRLASPKNILQQPPEWNSSACEKGAPLQLSRTDIVRLLHDGSRHELHTLVTESIEHCSNWRQIARALEYHTDSSIFENDRHHEDGRISAFENTKLAESLIEARKNLRLWNHRLTMLEWIAAAQSSMRWELLLKQKGTKHKSLQGRK